MVRRDLTPRRNSLIMGSVARKSEGGDGHFDLQYKAGWAWLTVHRPGEHGRPVYYEDVRNRMKLLGVPNVSFDTVSEIIDEASGVPQPIVKWPDGERLASRISVQVSDDGIRAWVLVTHPKKGAAPPSVEDVTGELTRQGITYGIEEQAIKRLLRDGRFDQWVEVACGLEPVHARSAEITYHFNPTRGKPYLELEFGRIDLKELNFIENKEAGDLLAELVEAVEPKDGRTVRNAVVPARTETQSVELRGGANTESNADGTAVYATAAGNVRLRDGAVVVEPVVTVDNVSYETGHIRHDGSVVVENHVADGFIVEATGDIQVGKGVGKATLKAGGNVLLKTGINGNGAGWIECDGNVFTRYVESSSVQCGGHLFVQEAIMHSRVAAWRHCVLNGRRSEIIASNMIVGGSLWCKQIGSVAEGSVYISIGIPPNVLSEFRATKSKLEDAQNRLEQVQQQLRPLENRLGEGGSGPSKLIQARDQLRNSAAELMPQVSQFRHDMNEIRKRLTTMPGSMLVAENSMYRGVVVAFGTKEYRVSENGVSGTVLRRPGIDIKEEGFNPADPPEIRFET